MKDSTDIRKINQHKIRTILWTGEEYTKQQIAVATGLSVATCNTLLNDMASENEVIGEKKRLSDVGRESICYQINEDYESILCLSFEMLDGEKILNLTLLSPIGRILKRKTITYNLLNYTVISENVSLFALQYSNISQIMVGTPSIAEFGIIKHSDIIELENENIVEKMMNEFQIPVYLENDMHFKGFGYYKKMGKAEEVITLANFPAHILPGTVSVHAGTILKGNNQFAGMVGFLPYEMSKEEFLAQLNRESSRPLISKAITSIIAIVNPGVIVFTGELVDEERLALIRNDCLEVIPADYMPNLIYKDDFDSYYIEGMYQKALELKGTIA